jgi:branched-chain amino acid transport system substrate-binding protein
MPNSHRTNKALYLEGQSIWIGIGTTGSGQYSRIGAEVKQSAELAVDEVNAAARIRGARIFVHAGDDRSTIEFGEAVARQFCERDQLLGVIGHYSSDISIAVSAIYHRCGLAMITPIASNPSLTKRGLENVFRFTNRDDYTGRAIAGFLYERLAKRRAVLVQSQYA